MTLKGHKKDWSAQLAGAKTALSELHSLDRQLREQHSAVQQERNRGANLPPPIEEIVANMEALIDAHAAEEVESLAYSLRSALGGGLEVQRDGRLTERRSKMPAWFHAEITFARLCAFAPDLVKERWAAILRAAPFEAGTPLAERAQMVAAAEERIAGIEREHEELVELAASLDPPVTLQFLPEVAARREQEKERRKREEAAARARAEAEARANAKVPAGVVDSPYLQRERSDV